MVVSVKDMEMCSWGGGKSKKERLKGEEWA